MADQWGVQNFRVCKTNRIYIWLHFGSIYCVIKCYAGKPVRRSIKTKALHSLLNHHVRKTLAALQARLACTVEIIWTVFAATSSSFDLQAHLIRVSLCLTDCCHFRYGTRDKVGTVHGTVIRKSRINNVVQRAIPSLLKTWNNLICGHFLQKLKDKPWVNSKKWASVPCPSICCFSLLARVIWVKLGRIITPVLQRLASCLRCNL